MAAQTYSMKRASALLGMPRTAMAALIRAGYVTPARGARQQPQLSFQDLMLLRTARELRLARVPAKRVVQSLAALKKQLPSDLPITGIRIRAFGSEVAVRDRQDGTNWEPTSGQMLLDFEVEPTEAGLTFLSRAEPLNSNTPRHHLDRGEALEAMDDPAAEQAYRIALQIDPDYIDAMLNLGAFLCGQARCEEAIDLYETALTRLHYSPDLYFNLAIALEDAGHLDGALSAYERCIDLDPNIADAHFNAARLHEQQGSFQAALRHFNAYRKLQRANS